MSWEKYNFKFIHKDKTLYIKADKKKIETVIYNLINNAINYTGDDNLVTIKITNKDNILVEIIDTGKGISKRLLKMLLKAAPYFFLQREEIPLCTEKPLILMSQIRSSQRMF